MSCKQNYLQYVAQVILKLCVVSLWTYNILDFPLVVITHGLEITVVDILLYIKLQNPKIYSENHNL
jgi:hypothetical protein